MKTPLPCGCIYPKLPKWAVDPLCQYGSHYFSRLWDFAVAMAFLAVVVSGTGLLVFLTSPVAK